MRCARLRSSSSFPRAPAPRRPQPPLRLRRNMASAPATHVNIGELVSASLCLAKKAAEAIREIQKSGKLNIQADLNSQTLIVAGLLNKWPALRIQGEEDLKQAPGEDTPDTSLLSTINVPEQFRAVPVNDIAVWIDPLDATKEFTLGRYECVMTLIGISVRGDPIAGVMYQPFVEDGRAYWGLRGLGAHGLRPVPREKKELILTVTSSRVTADTQRAIDCIKPDRVVHAGGAGYKILLVLERRADVYVLPGRGTKKWDTCAPEALLRAAGGSLTDAAGSRYSYAIEADHNNSTGVIASLGIEHESIVSALAKHD